MTENTHYCVLTPEGAITADTFLIADKQPIDILEGCLLVVHQPSGKQLTVHRTRLIPLTNQNAAYSEHKLNVCHKCGKVEGVVLERVICPHHGGTDCGLLAPKR
jgi:hypothetical protein